MDKLVRLTTCLVFLTITCICNAQTEADQIDAKGIINKAIVTMGGETYLRSIKTLYTEMATEMQGRQVIWITKEMLPNQGAFQIVYNGNIVYEDWFNGKKGFEMSGGKKKQTDPGELSDKFPRKNIFNELDYLDSTIYKIERLNDEEVKSIDCYKIKATFISGLVRYIFIDKSTFNTIREDKTTTQKPSEISTTYFSDYKKFGDLLFYSKLTIGDGPDAHVATITTLLVNEKVKESDFKK